jgi:dipeptidyl aminopeptidase/acylaminoacyl peptidase
MSASPRSCDNDHLVSDAPTVSEPRQAQGPGEDVAGVRTEAPYGTWPSLISAALVAQHATAYDALQADGRAIYWLETRPHEAGRTVVVRWIPERGAVDVTPEGFNVGTRVHEYGGGAYLVAEGVMFCSRLDDGRLYRLDPGAEPRPITPRPPIPHAVRYADLRVTPDRRWLVGVCERHEPDAVVNELVVVPAGGAAAPRILSQGHDFYASPRPSPDGRRLAWVTWDRPQMPWDGSDLWVADFRPDGTLGRARHIAGGPQESIVQPEWAADGRLLFVSDRSGWWNLYRSSGDGGQVEPLLPMAVEFADPPWELGYSSYALLADGRIACRYRQDGTDHLGILGLRNRHLEPLAVPFTSIKPYLRATPDKLAFIAASPTSAPAVMTLDLAAGGLEVLAGGGCPIPTRYVATSKPITFPGFDGRPTHGYFYPPVNPTMRGPNGHRPPLLVQPHPGPTTAATARLELRVQLFTSRGFAVVDVNYAGSTGYGRAYRERLSGQWGVADVVDCLQAARHLVAAGEVDPQRIIIAGASAGGFTALCALAEDGHLAGGVSYFGIADLEAFRQRAPKFQAHELDRLIGPYPQAADRYRARSPLHLATRIRRPVLLLQGLDDPVVPPAHGEAMANALKHSGVPHEYLVFAGEGHGFQRVETIQRALEVELAFYRRVLGLG